MDKNEMKLLVDETSDLIRYLGSRKLSASMGLSVLISTAMAVIRQLGLPDDLLDEMLAEVMATSKELLDKNKTRH